MKEHPLKEIYRWLQNDGTERFSDVIDEVMRVELCQIYW